MIDNKEKRRMWMKKSSKIIIVSVVLVTVILFIALCGYSFYTKSNFISKERAKEIVIEDTKLDEKDISFKEIKLDLEGETKKYEIEFYYNRVEYKYEIDAKNGKIIYSDFIQPDKTPTSNMPTNNNTTTDIGDFISVEEAKSIALKDTNLKENEVVFTDMYLDIEQDRTIYKIDFQTNQIEYEYEIDAINKSIISKSQEPRD